jgi:hypothetical protein
MNDQGAQPSTRDNGWPDIRRHIGVIPNPAAAGQGQEAGISSRPSIGIGKAASGPPVSNGLDDTAALSPASPVLQSSKATGRSANTGHETDNSGGHGSSSGSHSHETAPTSLATAPDDGPVQSKSVQASPAAIPAVPTPVTTPAITVPSSSTITTSPGNTPQGSSLAGVPSATSPSSVTSAANLPNASNHTLHDTSTNLASTAAIHVTPLLPSVSSGVPANSRIHNSEQAKRELDTQLIDVLGRTARYGSLRTTTQLEHFAKKRSFRDRFWAGSTRTYKYTITFESFKAKAIKRLTAELQESMDWGPALALLVSTSWLFDWLGLAS